MLTEKFIITKDTILDAIEDEPIGLRDRFDIDDMVGQGIYNIRTFQVDAGCAVCAVGAVLRTASIPSWFVNALPGIGYGCSATSRAKDGMYLQALSITYEVLLYKNRDITVDELREHLTDWVERVVPNDYVVSFEVGNVAD